MSFGNENIAIRCKRQIANAHTLFNLINVIIQLPFANLLVKIARAIVPGDDKLEVQEGKVLGSKNC